MSQQVAEGLVLPSWPASAFLSYLGSPVIQHHMAQSVGIYSVRLLSLSLPCPLCPQSFPQPELQESDGWWWDVEAAAEL